MLSVFAPVRDGESITALLLMSNVFILLTAYYIIKPVRESLILAGAGAEIKSYAGAVQALLLLALVPLYSAVARRVNRILLINAVTAFFISNLAVFYALGRAGVHIGVPFFLWVGLFNVLLVAQFWGFANDIYTQEQGKRLFAIVGIGSSTGAIFGAAIAKRLFSPLGPYPMMLVAAAMLAAALLLTNWINRRERRAVAEAHGAHPLMVSATTPIGGQGAFQLIFSSRYLLLIAFLVLLSNLVNTTGEFILGKVVKEHALSFVAANNGATQEQYIGNFYADFFFWVNLTGALLQLFAVSRIMKYLGIGRALFILPLTALCGYTLLSFAAVLSVVRFAKIAENSADYSIQNTARHALFLRTSRAEKYKAQAAIESFFWRAGDGCSALLVFTGTQLAFTISRFALINAVLVLVWLLSAVWIVRLRQERKAALQLAA